MSLTALGAIVLLGLWLGLTPSAAGGARGSRGPCWPPDSTTLAKSSQVRAYTFLDPLSYSNRPEITLDACDFRTGQTASLADAREAVFFYAGPALHVNGRVIGFTLQIDPHLSVRSERLPDRDAARRWSVPDVKVGSVRVTRTGGIALIQCPVELDAPPPDPRPECVGPRLNDVVRLIECDGTRRRLGRGRGIDPRSLRLLADDRTLVWLKNGKRQTGRFRVRCGAPEIQDPDGPGPRSGEPSIIGEARVGVGLRAIPGRWSLQPRFDYRLFRCDQAGESCSKVSDSFFYRPTAADVGARLRAQVIARDFAGVATALSPPTEPVAPAPGR